MERKEIVLHALITQREELTAKLFGRDAIPSRPVELSDSNAFDDFVRKERDLLDEFILKVMAHPVQNRPSHHTMGLDL